MSNKDPSGICLVYGTDAAEQEEEKVVAGVIPEPDQGRHALEPTLVRSAVAEEGVEPLGDKNVGSDTNLPIQTSGRADLFASVDGPSFKDQSRQTSSPVAVTQSAIVARKPPATSSLPRLNENIMLSDNPHNYASLSQVVGGDGEPVMIDAHYLENDGTNADLAVQSTAHDGNVYDADAFALTGGYFVKRRCIIAIVGLFVLAAAVVGGVCGSGMCRPESGPTPSPTTLSPTTMFPSVLPSSMPTVGPAAKAMIEFINSVTLSGNVAKYPISSDRSGSATPEERALAWLIQKDPLPLSPENESDRKRLVQRYALLTFWYSLNGDAWVNNDGWLEEEDECTWYGIECTTDSLVTTVGITVGPSFEDGAWSRNNLSGTIPADVALLVSVTQINLSENEKITGTLLPSIANLKNLNSFVAFSCGLRYCSLDSKPFIT